jgi:hypothetical protein
MSVARALVGMELVLTKTDIGWRRVEHGCRFNRVHATCRRPTTILRNKLNGRRLQGTLYASRALGLP